MKVDLPSGATAELLAPDRLRAKHVRAMTRAISTFTASRAGSIVVDVTDGAISIAVLSWTCTDEAGDLLPIPSEDLNSLDEMDAFDYYKILNHEYVTEINRKFTALREERDNPDDYADPDSPTRPSDGSGPVSKAEVDPTTAIAPKRKRTAGASGT